MNPRLFPKYKALKEAREIHQDTRAEIELAHKIASKLKPLLPKGWTTRFVIGQWRGLCVSFFTDYDWKTSKKIESSAMDWKLVCNLVEKVTGVEVKKSPWIEGDYLMALQGEAVVEIPRAEDERPCSLTVLVRHHNPSDCKLEYETKEVRVAKVDDACLGLMGDDK